MGGYHLVNFWVMNWLFSIERINVIFLRLKMLNYGCADTTQRSLCYKWDRHPNKMEIQLCYQFGFHHFFHFHIKSRFFFSEKKFQNCKQKDWVSTHSALQNPLCLYGNTVFQGVHALKSSFYVFLVFSCVEDTCQKHKSSPHYQTLDIFLTLTSGDSRWHINIKCKSA